MPRNSKRKSAPDFLAHEPESRWAVPDWSHPQKNVVVHPDDSGQKPTLREAIQDAAPNSCLLLKPGLYRESLVIQKDLQIRPADPLREVIIESLSSSVIVLDGASLLLAHLKLRGVGGKEKKPEAAVEVKSGHLVMKDCDLTSDASTVVEVKGANSEAILRRCHLHDGSAGGILSSRRARSVT